MGKGKGGKASEERMPPIFTTSARLMPHQRLSLVPEGNGDLKRRRGETRDWVGICIMWRRVPFRLFVPFAPIMDSFWDLPPPPPPLSLAATGAESMVAMTTGIPSHRARSA